MLNHVWPRCLVWTKNVFGFNFLLASSWGCTLYLPFSFFTFGSHFYTIVFFALCLCSRGLHVLYFDANSMKVEVLNREHQKHLPLLVLLFPVAVQVALTESSHRFLKNSGNFFFFNWLFHSLHSWLPEYEIFNCSVTSGHPRPVLKDFLIFLCKTFHGRLLY